MKLIVSIFFCSMILSCSRTNKVPREIIPADQMSAILWDVIRAQVMANEVSRNDSSMNAVTRTKSLTQKVFEIHKVTSSSFDKSYEWYSGHPDILRLMFDSLYTQKQRENESQMKDRYNHINRDSLSRKFLKK
ncbi:MAG: DUF4296 domain-containing protein [Ginsengibacter sp.]